MPDDLGFGKLLDDDGLLARLLGKTARGRNRPLLYGPDLPVVFLTGGPGMGKGRLLACVHDGVRTIAQAVFLANARSAGSVPPRERVAAQWSRLESAHRVAGTSGWVCLTNAGNPYDKPVAVVELDPRTRKLRFVGLGWPGGRVQPRDCVVPSG
ncbi:hypothetical protein C9F11_21795 [Streptomyces sp. YIM 121038]|uniref:hypothetical protein n=1 Tax=Streptomyces sp. YIM 121038 TaxID=2136401 RepID=UPI001110158A|nr:hypothetical protein [Streptomyces sp. YIM 121038]QCX77989.1 hypothetical protein C9F11_21795 [Streptomyces sp. YIM 121038]